jgi:hypothetical protein
MGPGTASTLAEMRGVPRASFSTFIFKYLIPSEDVTGNWTLYRNESTMIVEKPSSSSLIRDHFQQDVLNLFPYLTNI